MINKKLFSFVFLKSEANSLRSLQANISKLDVKVVLVCLIVAFSLTCTRYLGDAYYLISILRDLNLTGLAQAADNLLQHHANAQLHQLIYWASVVIFFYFVFPACIILLVFKENLTEYGLQLKNAGQGYPLYLGMLAIMVPLVFYFSGSESFLVRYPFYTVASDESLFPNFFFWEIVYFLQFLALEFFFRGFILHGTKHRFGFYAIFVMVIPYCMIHFGKPMPETIAAIIAGVVLGFLSLKSKSIWLGVMIHCSVALTMDLCALYRKGLF
ncbi:CAAX prenyl protease-like protein [Nitrosomonas oligotropha]|uniref:CAAX prenyl protease-like protein n=1 Tax=Nitrosomonas oligotropha TaxID=42354 RepID=A0A2T5I4V6_9PROT|nr:CPBP family intramembrane glutamic endopeptidase [Nitrosomonas oligotropha]PTQ78860.1 CAAX prenyl protease-like protein [Nitrosomonas oligotropha]